MKINRRTFLFMTALFPSILAACRKEAVAEPDFDASPDLPPTEFSRMLLQNNTCILFIGDSITDASRVQTIFLPNIELGLGNGYVKHITQSLLSDKILRNISIYNRGVSGSDVSGVLSRWPSDGMKIQPDIVTIMIGVNDLRRGRTPESFYKIYKQLIETIIKDLPEIGIMVCELFVMPNIENYESIKHNFHEYRIVIRKLVEEYHLTLVPSYEVFVNEAKSSSISKLTLDGFHPTEFGHYILSKTWLSLIWIFPKHVDPPNI